MRIARFRSEAFVDYTPRLCGLDIEPITLRSYSRLIAFDSPFVCGGPVGAEDIAIFIWIHRPEFAQRAPAERRRIFCAVLSALHPVFPRLNELGHVVRAVLKPSLRACHRLAPRRALVALLDRWLVPSHSTRFSEAVIEIRRLVAESLADFPSERRGGASEDEDKITAQGPTVALQAHFMHTLASGLNLSIADVETMPLRRAVQLYRDCIVTAGAKGIALMHPEEARVWQEELA